MDDVSLAMPWSEDHAAMRLTTECVGKRSIHGIEFKSSQPNYSVTTNRVNGCESDCWRDVNFYRGGCVTFKVGHWIETAEYFRKTCLAMIDHFVCAQHRRAAK